MPRTMVGQGPGQMHLQHTVAERKVCVILEYFSKRLLASTTPTVFFCGFCYRRHIELSKGSYYIRAMTGKRSLSVAL